MAAKVVFYFSFTFKIRSQAFSKEKTVRALGAKKRPVVFLSINRKIHNQRFAAWTPQPVWLPAPKENPSRNHSAFRGVLHALGDLHDHEHGDLDNNSI